MFGIWRGNVVCEISGGCIVGGAFVGRLFDADTVRLINGSVSMEMLEDLRLITLIQKVLWPPQQRKHGCLL